ncbi:MAG: type II/IV secretion system protein [Bacteroidetes bacterium]|nr:type II/IV secretion system protein [Bacteroidota bacterium]
MAHTDFIPMNAETRQLITADQAWHYHIIPKKAENGKLLFYADANEEKSYAQLKDELELLFGKIIEFEAASTGVIRETLSRYYMRGSEGRRALKASIDIRKADDFLENLIVEAKQLNASDIHVETYGDRCRIRFRIDGLLIERYTVSKTDYPALINKIKIRANLDIAEKRLPQDGRIFYEHGEKKFDIRVSIVPALYGEKTVLRLLNKDATEINIEELGFSDGELAAYLEGVRKPFGIVLISGPTGSGKTTTLYATLKILNKEKTNILTIEDPIEYTLEGINQVQVKENIGLTFSGALRSFLRQDPDIIMLGEIRDTETANMAIRAALTGHLVLSTIHTNSAWGTISRLIDMGVPSYLLANTLNLSAAQRLVRLLCPSCKEEQPFGARSLPKNCKPPVKPQTHFTPKGCEQCFYTGYKGRKAIYEVIAIDSELAENIKNGTFAISSLLKEKGIRTLAENAFDLFAEGNTSLEEVYPMIMSG